MKALSAYTSQFANYEQRRSDAWKDQFKPIFKIESIWEKIDLYFDEVDRDDVIIDLIKKKKKEVLIDIWSPYKLEGFHSLHLEKAMRYRYANYDSKGWSNISNAYGTESKQAENRKKVCSEMYKSIHQWKGDAGGGSAAGVA